MISLVTGTEVPAKLTDATVRNDAILYAHCYLAIQRSVWRDIKFAFFVCLYTVEDISTQNGAIGVKFWLRVEQTPETGKR